MVRRIILTIIVIFATLLLSFSIYLIENDVKTIKQNKITLNSNELHQSKTIDNDQITANQNPSTINNYIYLDENFLVSLGNSVKIHVISPNSSIQIGVAKASDLVPYCFKICEHKISYTSDQNFNFQKSSWTDVSNLNDEQNIYSEILNTTSILNTNDDIFAGNISTNNEANYEWINVNDSKWSMLIVLNSEGVLTTDQSVEIEFSWFTSISNYIILPCIFISFLLYSLFILILVLLKSKQKNGKHIGQAKTVSDIINKTNSNFSMPSQVKIESAKKVANNQKSLLNNSLINSQNTFYNSPIEDNNVKMPNESLQLFLNDQNRFNAENSISSDNSALHYSGLTRSDIRKLKKDAKNNDEQE